MFSRPDDRPFLLEAPDGGLPGIPGGGPGQGSGGLPGIPGSGPSGGWSSNAPAPSPRAGDAADGGTPIFAQPTGPTPMGPTYELASWGARFGAWIVDILIVWVLAIPFIAVASAIGVDTGTSTGDGASFSFSSNGGQFVAVMLIYLLAVLLYAPTTMATMQGATLGKRMVGIRVVRADGQPVTFGYAAFRELLLKGVVLGIISFVTFTLGWLINYLWPLWDSENRAGHDFAARSRVVRR